MSFSLYWRPLPKDRPEAESGYQLKWAIARQFGQRDGSCREGPFTFTMETVNWLRGVRDALEPDSDMSKEATALIKTIRDNPQGVTVWIGDHDEF